MRHSVKRVIALLFCLMMASIVLPVGVFIADAIDTYNYTEESSLENEYIDGYSLGVASTNTYNISFGMPKNGSYVVGDPVEITVNENTLLSEVALPAYTASVGYKFKAWSANGIEINLTSYYVTSDIILTPVFTVAESDGSLAFNSSFEIRDSMPTGWVEASGTAYRDASVYRDGGASLLLSGANSVARQRYIPVVGGKTYTISAWFKVNDISACPRIEVSSYKGTSWIGKDASTDGTQKFTTDGWTQMTLTYTPIAEANFMQVAFNSGSTVADVWVDCVTISGDTDFTDFNGNYIKNGNLAADLSNWEIVSNSDYADIVYDNSTGYPSSGSVLLTSRVQNPCLGGTGVAQLIPVEPGKTYDVSVYFKSDVPDARPQLQLTNYVGGGEISSVGDTLTMTAGTSNDTWTEFLTTYTAPETVTAVSVLFTAENLSATGGNVWFDAISVVEAVVEEHTHSMIYVKGQVATCTEDGVEGYYVCSNCNKKYSDSKGNKKITAPVVIPATGVHVDYINDGVCDNCGKAINLVKNPGFEAGTAGWKKAAYGTISVDSTYPPHNGEKALRTTGNAIVQTAEDAKIPVEAGKQYEFSAYFYTDDPEAKPEFDYYCYDSNGERIAAGVICKFDTAPTSGWEKLSGILEIPADVVEMRLSIPTNSTAGNVWIDSVCVEEYIPGSTSVLNGNFEAGTAGWKKAAYGIISVDSTYPPHNGEKSLKMTCSAIVQTAEDAKIPVEAGKQYEFSAYFYTDDPEAKPEIDYYCYNSNGERIATGVICKFDIAPTSVWEKLSGVLEIPIDVVAVRLSIPCNSTATDKAVWLDTVSVKRHIHSITCVEGQNATCILEGYQGHYVCSGCNKMYSDLDGNSEITAPVVIPATGEHNYVDGTCTGCGATEEVHEHNYGTVVTAPTCTEAGYTTYTCPSCGHSYTGDEVAATGVHVDDNNDGVCDNCSKAINLVYNPSFDTGVGGWQRPDNGYHTHDATVGHNSAGSLKAVAAVQTGKANLIPVEAGKKYEFSAYFYTDDPEAKVTVDFYGLKLDGSTVKNGGVVSKTTLQTNDWAKLSGIFEIPEGVEAIRLSITINRTTGSVWMDDVSLTMAEVEEHTHSYEAVVTEPTCTEAGYTTYTCTVCGDSYVADEVEATGEHTYVDGVCTGCGATEETPKFDIAMTNMRMGTNLSMMFAFKQSDVNSLGLNDVKAVITVDFNDDRADRVVEIPKSKENWTTLNNNGTAYYVVELGGLAAKEMSDNISIQIFAGDEAISNVKTTSLREYGEDRLKNSTNAEFKTTVVDMLNYGAAAQSYFGYNTANLANANIEEYQDLATPEVALSDVRKVVAGEDYFKASNVRFVSDISMMFAVSKNANGVRAEISFRNHNGKPVVSETTEYSTATIGGTQYNVYELTGMVVADYSQDITFRLYDADGDVVVETIDSLEAYAKITTGGTMKALTDAFIKFGNSAYNYAH